MTSTPRHPAPTLPAVAALAGALLLLAAFTGCSQPRTDPPAPFKPALSPRSGTQPSHSRPKPPTPAAAKPAIPAQNTTQAPPAPPPPASTTTTPPAATPPAPAPAPADEFRTVFPSVRVNIARRTVEFDGTIPIDVHDPDTPRVYLELIACTPDSREHESLVLTTASAEQVHAALLMAGFQHGSPGSVQWDGRTAIPVAPTGDALTVRFRTAQGQFTPEQWIISASTGQPLAPIQFVFAGSGIVQRRDPASGQRTGLYAADLGGTLIGLATFGTETVAPLAVLSHDSQIQAPEWIAAPAVPRSGTPVTVILSAP
ncbi:MAG: YdjY domain-containing protein [Planctomycetaceae bacterium]|jgi:hypothetical protein|nr:YdjY domain-containing protein [Planctomycetaceae bacterium]